MAVDVVIVKVGTQSDIILFRTQMIRAITVDEVNIAIKKYPQAKALIIENIEQDEYDAIRDIAKQFTSNNGQLFFYIKDSDEVTCGLADEMMADIAIDFDSLREQMTNRLSKDMFYDIENQRSKSKASDLFGETEDTSDASDASDDLFGADEEEPKAPETKEEPNKEPFEVSIIGSEKSDSVFGADNSDFYDSMYRAGGETSDIGGRPDSEGDEDEEMYRELYEQAKAQLEESQKIIAALDDERETLEEELKSLISSDIGEVVEIAEYESAVAALTEYEEKVTTLQEMIDSGAHDERETERMRQELEDLKATAEETEENMRKAESSMRSEIQSERDARRGLTEIADDLLEKMAGIDVEIAQMKEVRDTLEEQVRNMGGEVELKRSQITDLSNQLAEAQKKYKEASEAAASVDERVELARSYGEEEKRRLESDVNEYRIRVDILSAQLAAKEEQYQELVRASGMDAGGINIVAENNKTLSEINNSLRAQVASLRADVEATRKDTASLNSKLRKMEDENYGLRNTLKSMAVSVSSGGSVTGIPPCNYSGRGSIIIVTGNGSYGVTTTAMSLAIKLSQGAKVLFVDFNTVSPSADRWFKINPIVKIPGLNLEVSKSTGLSIFVEKGIKYVVENTLAILNRVTTAKNGVLDYISGFYSKPDLTKFIAADYTSLFNYFGNNYSFVIVDMGVMGASEVHDQLIKVISDASYRSVLVTKNDKFAARTFRLKANSVGIRLDNAVWLLNMCTSTSIEATTQTAVSPATIVTMPRSETLGIEQVDFSKDKLTRDKLEVLNSAIFRT